MKHRQQGLTVIGFLLIAAMVGLIGYGGIRLMPLYMNQMKVQKILTDLKAEYEGENPSIQSLQNAIGKRLDVDYIDFPKRQDFAISKTDDGLRVNVSYEDRVPYIANLYLTAVFDNSVEIRR